jgi:hypothetical protein
MEEKHMNSESARLIKQWLDFLSNNHLQTIARRETVVAGCVYRADIAPEIKLDSIREVCEILDIKPDIKPLNPEEDTIYVTASFVHNDIKFYSWETAESVSRNNEVDWYD